MKTSLLPTFRVLSLLLLLALSAGCASTPEADLGHLERDPEALGRRTGRADALAGRDDDYSRHLHELHPDADEDDFEDAYDEAYEEAEEEMEEREERRESAAGRAYDAGHAQGELDRRRGLSRDPDRHRDAGLGSSRDRNTWVDGYLDGWNDD